MAGTSLDFGGIVNSLTGVAKNQQNAQQLSIEQQKVALNQQITAQNAAASASSSKTIIVIVVISFAVLGIVAYFLFGRK